MISKRMLLLSKKYHMDVCIEVAELYPGLDNAGTKVEIYIPFSYDNTSS
jgi:hypothetical protein